MRKLDVDVRKATESALRSTGRPRYLIVYEPKHTDTSPSVLKAGLGVCASVNRKRAGPVSSTPAAARPSENRIPAGPDAPFGCSNDGPLLTKDHLSQERGVRDGQARVCFGKGLDCYPL
jgi:hypothetical protein